VLSQAALTKLVKDDLFPRWEAERDRLERIDRWYRWQQDDIRLPRKATRELQGLAELSKVPWLQLVVTACAQAMYVDGYRSRLDPAGSAGDGDPRDVGAEPAPPWRTWLANGMDRRQVAVHRAALAYGFSFVTVLPGEDPVTGREQAVMRGVSPRALYAAWDDPAEDDWPRYALRLLERRGDDEQVFRVYDDTATYVVVVGEGGTKVTVEGEPQVHDVGVCPVVRYSNMLDLDGRTPGEVEPVIPLAARINKTAYDRMLTQHFNSWKIRTVSGMAEPDTDEDANRARLKLRQDDLLVAEDPDTKFGTLDETPLEGFIAAHRADVETLAAVTQTPTHELTGQMANLSAEALAAARASLSQKVTERQKSFGQSHAQGLRLAAAIDGHDDYAVDVTGRVTWQDMEIRSISQAVDALGKAAQMLQIPPSVLWSRIPGVEKSDVEEWLELAKRGDPIVELQARLERQATPAGGDGVAQLPVAG
jgi:hypothetical protein